MPQEDGVACPDDVFSQSLSVSVQHCFLFFFNFHIFEQSAFKVCIAYRTGLYVGRVKSTSMGVHLLVMRLFLYWRLCSILLDKL